MTTAYTSLLGLALPVTGELSGTWGDIVNNSITSLLDSSIAGTTNVSTDTDVTLTTTTGAANTAREAILLFSGARTALRTITAPAQSKVYTVINATTGGYSVKLVGAGPTTGVTIVAGESAVCAWNGSDFVKVSNTGGTASFTNVTVTGTTTLSGLTASTALALDASKNVVSVTNTGTGNNVLAASPSLTGTVTIATLNLTNALGTTYGGTGLTSFTANGVVYASSSSALATGSALTFDGTNLGVGTASPSEKVGINQGNIYALRTGGAKLRLADQNNECSVESSPTSGDSQLVFKSNATEGMRLTSTGLGIGTSSPAQKLDVSGTIQSRYDAAVNDATVGAYNFYNTNANASANPIRASIVAGRENSAWGAYLDFYTSTGTSAQSSKMRLDSSGNLGLGVTPPNWSSGGQISLGNNKTIVASGEYTNLGTNWYYSGGYNKIVNGYATNYYQALGAHIWQTAGTGSIPFSFTSAMTLTAAGNLGVGTTSPSARLHATGADQLLRLQNDNAYMQFANTANTDTAYIQTTASIFNIISQVNGAMVFGTNSAERARIDSSGNMGIGTTSPATKLEVNGVVAGTSTGVDGTFAPVFNALYNSNTAFYGQIQASMSSSASASGFRFMGGGTSNISGSGGLQKMLDLTRGATIFYTSDTERARIDSSGNLLVGVTSVGLGKLTVGGTIATSVSSGGTFALSYTTANTSSRSWRMANDVTAYGDFAIQQSTTQTGSTFATQLYIDSSGNLLVGTTSNVGSARVNVSFSGPSNDGVDIIDASDGSGSQFIAFRNSAGTAIGTVTRVTTTNAVTYNTTSDYRLKNVIGSVLGSGQRIDALKPIDYIWKESGQNARGFLAHEFQTVYPNSVTGDKDAIDADGNPVYQGMQASTAEVIADLVAEIQSLRKRLADAGI